MRRKYFNSLFARIKLFIFNNTNFLLNNEKNKYKLVIEKMKALR